MCLNFRDCSVLVDCIDRFLFYKVDDYYDDESDRTVRDIGEYKISVVLENAVK